MHHPIVTPSHLPFSWDPFKVAKQENNRSNLTPSTWLECLQHRIHLEQQQKTKQINTRTRRGSATHTVHLFALQVTIHVGDRVESITRPQLLVSFTMHLYTTTASLTDKNNDGVSFKGRWWSRWPLAPVNPPPAPRTDAASSPHSHPYIREQEILDRSLATKKGRPKMISKSVYARLSPWICASSI
jgi:hypothetical protein